MVDRRLADCERIGRWQALLILLLALGCFGRVEARSTLVARFAEEEIVGPGIVQTVVMYLHYFPGDGEAIVRSVVHVDPTQVELTAIQSALGKARTTARGLEVDYVERPLAKEYVDTLSIALISQLEEQTIHWRAEIFSSLDPQGEAAHGAGASLVVRPPLELAVEVIPRQVFPGETVGLQIVVYNRDTRQRAIDEIVWHWPAGDAAFEQESSTRWVPGLQPGRRDTLVQQVRIAPSDTGVLALGGWARTTGLAGSPVPIVEFQVIPLPEVQLYIGSGPFEVGKPARVVCKWTNHAAVRLELEALRLELGEAFDQVSVVTGPGVLVGERGTLHIDLESVGALEPEQSVQIDIEVRPLRAGPFVWQSFARPSGRRDFVPLPATLEAPVVVARARRPAPGRSAGLLTDLRVVHQVLGNALRAEMERLPLLPGKRVYLQPYVKAERNWLVEDALTSNLMDRGVGILLRAPQSAELDVGTLFYRVVDARVVYRPPKRSWLLWRGERRRETFGDLFLHLEDAGGRLLWAGRVKAFGHDLVPASQLNLLSGGEQVKRKVLETDNRLFERGLSASIIGGLFYIFFLL